MEQTQSFGPILILLVLIVSFLYMHFTNGSGLTRIYLAGAIVLAAILILLPSLNISICPVGSRRDSAKPKFSLVSTCRAGRIC